jgi:hypothetical protein
MTEAADSSLEVGTSMLQQMEMQKFEYCVGHENMWTFSYADTPDVEVHNPCVEPRNFVRAQSGESDTFDLTRKPLDKWYSQSKSNLMTQLLPLQHISICNAERKEQKDCGSNGNFNQPFHQAL